jgi:hypothetical protein
MVLGSIFFMILGSIFSSTSTCGNVVVTTLPYPSSILGQTSTQGLTKIEEKVLPL